MKKEKEPSRQIYKGIAALALTAIPVLGLSALAPFPTQALSDQDLCVTAIRLDDTKVSATTCQSDDIPSPEPSPTEPVSTTETPTATPTATTAPIVLGPGVANGEVFLKPVKTVYDMRQVAPLNDGGMITVQSDGVWMTPKLRVDPIKLAGLDANLANPIGVEASANGQTIAVFTERYIQVSWDGGATWLAPQEQAYYSIGLRFRDITVSENGGSIITVSENGTKDPTITGRAMGLTKQSGLWKVNGLMFGYKPFMSNDGVTALQPVFNQRITKSIAIETMASPTVHSLPTGNFTAFATSGNFATQLATMDSTESKLSIPDRAMGLRISRDKGLTWSLVSFGAFTNLQVSADGQKMISVDSSNVIRLSTDNGVTWNVIDPIGNGVKSGKIEMAPDGKTMLIMGTDGKTYQTSVAQVIP